MQACGHTKGKGEMGQEKSFCSETYKIEFCDVCKKDLNMKVVGDNADEDFIWCRCPECKGVAPYPRVKEKNDSFTKNVTNNKQED